MKADVGEEENEYIRDIRVIVDNQNRSQILGHARRLTNHDVLGNSYCSVREFLRLHSRTLYAQKMAKRYGKAFPMGASTKPSLCVAQRIPSGFAAPKQGYGEVQCH
jgi:hypothetical protein